MAQLTISEEKVREAMSHAQTDEAREIIRSLFPEVSKKKPTLDDYTSITSYEDACEALGESPVLSKDYVRGLYNKEGDIEFYIYGREKENTEWITIVDILPKHIIALMKLETISRALWGWDWQPKPDAEEGENLFWPWFTLWTKEEIDKMDDDKNETFLSALATDGADAGFGFLHVFYRSSRSIADFGFRLCQETEEKAKYFGGRNFIKLWAEYLQFNFDVGDFLTEEEE